MRLPSAKERQGDRGRESAAADASGGAVDVVYMGDADPSFMVHIPHLRSSLAIIVTSSTLRNLHLQGPYRSLPLEILPLKFVQFALCRGNSWVRLVLSNALVSWYIHIKRFNYP